MFRLNDAVRRHQARQPKPAGLQCVAATVTMLSPRKSPDAASTVASVAAVAAPPTEPANIPHLIEELRQAGASLQCDGGKLAVRPSHWAQLVSVSTHWETILLFLEMTDHGDGHGAGRSA